MSEIRPDTNMQSFSRWRVGKMAAFLFSTSFLMLLVYHKILLDRGLLQRRRSHEHDIGQILDYYVVLQNGSRLRVGTDQEHSPGTDFYGSHHRGIKSASGVNKDYDYGSKFKMKEYLGENDETETKVNQNKYLIYLCNHQRPCGGWEERKVGIVSTFLLANVTNRIFKVSMTSPCKLQQFMIPASRDWIVTMDELKGKSLIVIGDVTNTSYLGTFRNGDFNSVYTEDVVFVRTNTDFINVIKHNPFYKDKLPAWATMKKAMLMRDVWKHLMMPAESTVRALASSLRGMSTGHGGNLICAEIHNQNKTESQKLVNKNILDYVQPYVGQLSKVFVATNSNEVGRMSRTRFGDDVVIVGDPLVNIDSQEWSAEACSRLQQVVVTNELLYKCSILLTKSRTFANSIASQLSHPKDIMVLENSKLLPLMD